MMTYIVYIFKDKDGHPVYVGCGTPNRVKKHNRNSRMREWCEANGRPIPDIVASDLTRDEAHALERALIDKYGRKDIDDGGVLLNLVLGGAGNPGWNPSQETRDKMSAMAARPRTDAQMKALAKASNANLGRARSPEAVAKAAAAIRGRKMSSEQREKMRRPKSTEHREKLRQAAQNRTPETIEKMRQAALNRSPEARAKASATKTGKPWSEAMRIAQLARRAREATQGIETMNSIGAVA